MTDLAFPFGGCAGARGPGVEAIGQQQSGRPARPRRSASRRKASCAALDGVVQDQKDVPCSCFHPMNVLRESVV